MIDLSKIIITPEFLSLIAEIDEFKGVWHLLGKLTPERLQALRKIATIESIGSSTRIEGAKQLQKRTTIPNVIQVSMFQAATT